MNEKMYWHRVFVVGLVICATLFTVSTTFADSLTKEASGPVWKVTDNQNTLYIGGTIHLLTPADYPLPSAFEKAYQQADQLVFEVDIQKAKTPEFQTTMMQHAFYPEGQNIQQLISASTYRQLADYIASRGGNIQQLPPFKVGMLTTILALEELNRLGLSGQGVDDFFDQRAIADNKPRDFLETIDQQLRFLSNMGEGQEDEYILYNLQELKNLPSLMDQLKSAWRSADTDRLAKVALDSWKNDFPTAYQDLLVTRNNAWMPPMESMLTSPEVEYVLVGALHLVGEDGVLQQLKNKGYRVELLK